jgi:glycosyltransferase involved in cell wall biosynthesis
MRIAILTTDNREPFKEYTNPVPWFGTAPEALLQGLALLPDVEVHVVSCARQRLAAPEKLAQNIFFHTLLVPKMGWMRTLYLGCVWATRRKLREIRPDIVHGQGTELDCGISAVFSGFPNVLTIHGNMRLIARVNQVRPFSFNWLAARLEGMAVPRSRGVVCITRYTQAAVASSARRTWVVPNAVDASFFEIAANPPSLQPPRILCVGLICHRKNQNSLIRALDALAEQKKFELVFLGKVSPGQPYDDEFISLAQARPWCVLAGFASREELKNRLQQASLVVLPSLEDNCPMVVLEAMAAGVPVVAAEVGGVPDLLEDGKTGFFCDPLDRATMRSAVERALTHPELAANLAANARSNARQRFHPRVVAERHLEIYREVLSQGR